MVVEPTAPAAGEQSAPPVEPKALVFGAQDVRLQDHLFRIPTFKRVRRTAVGQDKLWQFQQFGPTEPGFKVCSEPDYGAWFAGYMERYGGAWTQGTDGTWY